MQRYFVSPDAIIDQKVRIQGDDVKHITRVLRLQPGAEVICANGMGDSYLVRLIEFQQDAVIGEIIETLQENVEAQVEITLVQGLPKGDKMDLIVQKGTEVGVARFVPVESRRVVVQYDAKKETKRLDRWQRIAKEAAEQSHRIVIPEITEPTAFAKWVTREAKSYDLAVLAYEAEHATGLRSALDRFYTENNTRVVPQSIAVIIGPEGGFDESEVQLAEQHGVKVITLGPRILRTETAGLVAAAMILYHYGQMGG